MILSALLQFTLLSINSGLDMILRPSPLRFSFICCIPSYEIRTLNIYSIFNVFYVLYITLQPAGACLNGHYQACQTVGLHYLLIGVSDFKLPDEIRFNEISQHLAINISISPRF